MHLLYKHHILVNCFAIRKHYNINERKDFMKITEQILDYTAALAKLTVSEDEKQKTAYDLERILDYIETINGLDTEGIEPMSHVLPISNVFREDYVTNTDNREQILANAPKRKEGSFAVPKTVE
jgi:aspartyl-tRNA(Asn)/glutamyl-tRNA(Gln) amidotransferase subunit C